MLFRTDYTIYTLPIFDRVIVRVSVRFNVRIKYSNSMIFKKVTVSGQIEGERGGRCGGTVFPFRF